MKNTLTLAKPLLAGTELLLTAITTTCENLKIPFFVAGATAREVILHHVHGTNMGRRTRDIDIAVFVAEWTTFDTLKRHFTEQGATPVASNAHRLILQGNEIDIIPFGDIAEDNKVAWPPDKAIVMSVDGFAEAFEHSVTVRLDNGTEVKFCSLPGLTLLKLFAWRDRGRKNRKDATDLYKIIIDYNMIENDRIYEPPVNGNDFDWDNKRMGAYLLGRDIASMLGRDEFKETVAELSRIDKARLTDAIATQHQAEESDEIERVIDDFWDGIFS